VAPSGEERAVQRPNRSVVGGRISPATEGRSPWLLPFAAIVSMLPLAHLVVPPALVLPAIGLLLLLAGFAIAACARSTAAAVEPERVGAQDIAGALVLLGFAALLLSDSEQALAVLDQLHTGLIASGPI
jgi:hypothetical protein